MFIAELPSKIGTTCRITTSNNEDLSGQPEKSNMQVLSVAIHILLNKSIINLVSCKAYVTQPKIHKIFVNDAHIHLHSPEGTLHSSQLNFITNYKFASEGFKVCTAHNTLQPQTLSSDLKGLGLGLSHYISNLLFNPTLFPFELHIPISCITFILGSFYHLL